MFESNLLILGANASLAIGARPPFAKSSPRTSNSPAPRTRIGRGHIRHVGVEALERDDFATAQQKALDACSRETRAARIFALQVTK